MLIRSQNLLLGVVIGQVSWSPLSSNVVSLGVGGKLEDGSLSVFSIGDDLFNRHKT